MSTKKYPYEVTRRVETFSGRSVREGDCAQCNGAQCGPGGEGCRKIVVEYGALVSLNSNGVESEKIVCMTRISETPIVRRSL